MKLMAAAKESISVDAQRGGTARQTRDASLPDGAPQFDGVLADVGANNQGHVAAETKAKTQEATVAASVQLSVDAGSSSMTSLLASNTIKPSPKSPDQVPPVPRAPDVVFSAAVPDTPSSATSNGALPDVQAAMSISGANVLPTGEPVSAPASSNEGGLVTSILKRLKGDKGVSSADSPVAAGGLDGTGASPDLMALLLLGAGSPSTRTAALPAQNGQALQSSATISTGPLAIDSDQRAANSPPMSASTSLDETFGPAVVVSDIAIETHLAPIVSSPVAAATSLSPADATLAGRATAKEVAPSMSLSLATAVSGAAAPGVSRQQPNETAIAVDAAAQQTKRPGNDGTALFTSLTGAPIADLQRASGAASPSGLDTNKPVRKGATSAVSSSTAPAFSAVSAATTQSEEPISSRHSFAVDVAATKDTTPPSALGAIDLEASAQNGATRSTSDAPAVSTLSSEVPTIRGEAGAASALAAMAPSTGLTSGPTRTLASAIVELASQPTPSASAETPKASLGPARTMTLQMNPAQLGTVGIRLHLTGRSLDVELTVSSSQTLGLINRERDTLSSALHDQSYQLNSLVVQDGGATASSGGNNGSQHSDAFGSGAAPNRQESGGTFSGDGEARRDPGAGRPGRQSANTVRTTPPGPAAGSSGGALFV